MSTLNNTDMADSEKTVKTEPDDNTVVVCVSDTEGDVAIEFVPESESESTNESVPDTVPDTTTDYYDPAVNSADIFAEKGAKGANGSETACKAGDAQEGNSTPTGLKGWLKRRSNLFFWAVGCEVGFAVAFALTWIRMLGANLTISVNENFVALLAVFLATWLIHYGGVILVLGLGLIISLVFLKPSKFLTFVCYTSVVIAAIAVGIAIMTFMLL